MTLALAVKFLAGFEGEKVAIAAAADASNVSSPPAVAGRWTVSVDPPINIMEASIGGISPPLSPLKLEAAGVFGTILSATAIGQVSPASTHSTSDGNWLSAGILAGNSSSLLFLNTNPAGLNPGTYSGATTLSVPGVGSRSIPVTLTVPPPPILTASPSNLVTQSFLACDEIQRKTIAIESTTGPVLIGVTQLDENAGWLGATLDRSVTPATLTVAINSNFVIGSSSTTLAVSSPGQQPLYIPVLNTTFAPPPFPPFFAVDATANFKVTRGGIRYNNATHHYLQTISLEQTSPVPLFPNISLFPLSVVLDGLSPNATLVNQSGLTTCRAPAESPYVTADGTNLILEFANPTNAGISYNTRVLVGAGTR